MTFPYTCPKDGIIRIGLRTNSTGNAYAWCAINGMIVGQNQNNGTTGSLVVQTYRVNTGDVITTKTITGGDIPIAEFVPCV